MSFTERFIEYREKIALRFARLFPHYITPNRLTLSRPIIFMPLCIFALIETQALNSATFEWVFLASWFLLGLTDFLDGPLSRLNHKQPKPLGQFLDRIADKASMIALYGFFARINFALIMPIIILELISAASAIVQWASEDINERIGATGIGKWKMTLQWALIPLLFYTQSHKAYFPYLDYFLGLTLLLTLVSVLTHLTESGLIEKGVLRIIGHFLSNGTTLIRFGLAYLILRELPDRRVEGIALLLLLLLTDIFDGMIARQMDSVTRLGAWLDLLTDNIVILIFYYWQYVSTRSILNMYSWLVMTVVTIFFLFLPYISSSRSDNKKLILNRIGYVLVISAVFGILLKVSYMNYFMAGIPLFLLLISIVIGWKPQVHEEKKGEDLQLLEKTG